MLSSIFLKCARGMFLLLTILMSGCGGGSNPGAFVDEVKLGPNVEQNDQAMVNSFQINTVGDGLPQNATIEVTHCPS